MKTFEVHPLQNIQNYYLGDGHFARCCGAGQAQTLEQLLSWDLGLSILIADEKISLPDSDENTEYGVLEVGDYFIHYKKRLAGERGTRGWGIRQTSDTTSEEKIFLDIYCQSFFKYNPAAPYGSAERYPIALPEKFLEEGQYLLTIDYLESRVLKEIDKVLDRVTELTFNNFTYRGNGGPGNLVFTVWRNKQ